jgi:hypothetical protein
VHYIAQHGESRVAKAALLCAAAPLMARTADNPKGLPKKVFDEFQVALAPNCFDFRYGGLSRRMADTAKTASYAIDPTRQNSIYFLSHTSHFARHCSVIRRGALSPICSAALRLHGEREEEARGGICVSNRNNQNSEAHQKDDAVSS